MNVFRARIRALSARVPRILAAFRKHIMKVSIIIPVKYINDYIREAVPHHLGLEYDDFEVLIFPDEVRDGDMKELESYAEAFPAEVSKEELAACDKKVLIIPSGATGPAEKRDLAFKYATGDIFAFTDDDAYPRKDWLTNTVKILEKDVSVGAVGGPAVTALGDDIWKQAGGKVYESFLCSGGYTYRFIPGEYREDDDIPSVNLIVKREVFEEVHGYDSTFYPGEDTKLCMDIVNSGKKLIYSPDVLVYHHRRSLFAGHLKQITNYAKHRGYFAKILPQTSLRPAYFIPTLFTLGLVFGPVVSRVFPALWMFYGFVLLLYFLMAAVSLRSCFKDNLGYDYNPDSIKYSMFYRIRLFLLGLAGILATHVGYGIFFVRGLLSKELLR